ncbi:nucleotide exchange factor GrpE [Marixanthomonas spongiae]|uniref:Protein GrpE n=1 Tax=Marixanthomonas spongiae TaxID=2174845 RepID=A0A2U0I0C5_9FLAO|nr:nucleotide exchange factor GrpE [Marixanthomonas spongiae]PVW14549.1 nucleotide exchange factor GrpE [Marixanthomonas spongiae]
MSKKDKTQKEQVVQEEEVATQEQEQTKDTAETESNGQDKIAQLQEEVEKEKERYLRLFAEFENYKRRTGRERVELFKTAGQDVITSLLPVMDDFDRALKEIEKTEDENLLKGVQLIQNKLKETLRSKGLEPIKTEQGDTFDAEIHDAVTQVPAPSDDLKGKIVDVIEKGYTLGEKIIRFPKVVIGQ